MFSKNWTACIFLIAVPLLSSAQLYKCTSPNGKVEFSDKPCASDKRPEYVNPRDNTIDTSGHREQAMRSEIRDLRQRVERAEIKYSNQNQTSDQTTTAQPKINQRACDEAKNQYEIAARSITDKSAAGGRLELMRSACGLPTPPSRQRSKIISDPYSGPQTITSCDASGCWDNNGGRYTRGAGNTYFGPNGTCIKTGATLQCP